MLVIAGGQDVNGPVGSVTAFDTVTGSVSRLGSLPARLPTLPPLRTEGSCTWSVDATRLGSPFRPSYRSSRRAEGSIGRPRSGALWRTPVPCRRPTGALLIGGWRGVAVDQVLIATLGTIDPTQSIAPGTPAAAGPRPARVRPFAGLLVIADRGNNRLLVMNAPQADRVALPLSELAPAAVPLLS